MAMLMYGPTPGTKYAPHFSFENVGSYYQIRVIQ